MIRGNSGSGIVNANKSRTSDKNTIVCTLAIVLFIVDGERKEMRGVTKKATV